MADLLDGITLGTAYDVIGTSCSSWAPAIADPANANDGDDSTYSRRPSGVKQAHCTYRTIWTADLGTDETAAGYRLRTSHVGEWSIEVADSPSGPWTEVVGGLDPDDEGTPDGTAWLLTGTFDPAEGRYWRAVHAYGPWGSGVAFIQSVQLFTWELYSVDETPPEPEPPVDPGDYVPPVPAKAIVEIYVDDPAGAKWDAALWDEAVWPAAFWDPIDDLSLSADVTNGTDRGELGIVAEPTAGRFIVNTYDPDRHLDPANAASPYAGQLEPGLPIRLNHRSNTFRTAIVEKITYSMALKGGQITAVDALGLLGEAMVPDDVELGDTLWTRVGDAIAASGVRVEMLAAPVDDPALVAYETGDELSVLEHLKRAALEVLWIPYVDRNGYLGFRDWTVGLERGRELDADELEDLGSWISDDGLYSRVVTLDPDGVTPVSREATPTPRYGLRTYSRRRDMPTIDAESWADRVLADRRAQTLRYRPGQLRPLTADSVDELGTLEIGEGVDIDVPEPGLDILGIGGPAVAEHVRIMGSRITVVDETRDPAEPRSRWRFTYSVAASPPVPLVDDDDDATFLIDDDDGEYLYAG